jgi:hypothetical protein
MTEDQEQLVLKILASLADMRPIYKPTYENQFVYWCPFCGDEEPASPDHILHNDDCPVKLAKKLKEAQRDRREAMKLKAIYHKDELCLATESGDIIDNVFSAYPTGMHATAGKRIQVQFTVIADLESTTKIVEADGQSVRALPAAPAWFVKGSYDYDPDEDYPAFHDEDCACLDCEEDDGED